MKYLIVLLVFLSQISLPEFIVMLEALLTTFISILTLKWPIEDKKDAELSAKFLLMFSILLFCAHYVKILIDQIEDHANSMKTSNNEYCMFMAYRNV